LEGAQFNEDALFNQTNLKRVKPRGTTGFSSSQINLAITDKETKLPGYLEEEMGDDFLLQMQSTQLISKIKIQVKTFIV